MAEELGWILYLASGSATTNGSMPFRVGRNKLTEPDRARMERTGARRRTHHQIPVAAFGRRAPDVHAGVVGWIWRRGRFGGDQDIPRECVAGEGLTGRFVLRVGRHRVFVRFNVP